MHKGSFNGAPHSSSLSYDRAHEWFQANGGQYNQASEKLSTTCPLCSATRKKKFQKCFTIAKNNVGYLYACFHCGARGVAIPESKRHNPYNPPTTKKRESIMDFANVQRDPTYLETRGISKATEAAYDVKYDESGNVKLPFFIDFLDEQFVKTKFIGQSNPPYVWAKSGMPKFFFGSHLAVAHETKDIVITEGEIDAMSIYEATGGEYIGLSLPSGAETSKIVFSPEAEKIISSRNCVYICTDMDRPGIMARDELARRFGRGKCRIVSLPHGIKDANEALTKIGADGLRRAVEGAAYYPVEGVSDSSFAFKEAMAIYDGVIQYGLDPCIGNVGDIFRLQKGTLCIATGTPGHGKSVFLDNVMVRAMVNYGWRPAVFSFETSRSVQIARMIQIKCERSIDPYNLYRMARHEFERELIDLQKKLISLGEDGIQTPLNEVYDRIVSAVVRFGIDMVVIDPFNYIVRGQGSTAETQLDFERDMLITLRSLARQYKLMIILVAHPNKISTYNSGNVDGYGISGSAHFFNVTDTGFTIKRDDQNGVTKFSVWKSRLKYFGKIGSVDLVYNTETDSFSAA